MGILPCYFNIASQKFLLLLIILLMNMLIMHIQHVLCTKALDVSLLSMCIPNGIKINLCCFCMWCKKGLLMFHSKVYYSIYILLQYLSQQRSLLCLFMVALSPYDVSWGQTFICSFHDKSVFLVIIVEWSFFSLCF